MNYGTGFETLGSLSSDVFERRASTGSGVFALFDRDFEQSYGKIVSLRIKTLSHTNLVASWHIKREKGSLPVDVRRSKTSLIRLEPETFRAQFPVSASPLVGSAFRRRCDGLRMPGQPGSRPVTRVT